MGHTTKQFKQINTFADFCKQSKSKHKTKITEDAALSVKVPFWQDAIDLVLNEIHSIAGTPADWRTLTSAIRDKFIILDREITDDDSLVLSHIKDILYQNYISSSFFDGDTADYGTSSIGTKTLVITQLATEILNQIRQETGLEPFPIQEEDPKPVATVSLTPDCYDDCWENKRVARQRYRNVLPLERFTDRLNESVAKISCEHDKKALDYVLNKLEAVAGSLKLEDVEAVVENEETTLQNYITAIAYDYLIKEVKIELNGDKIDGKEDLKNVVKQARKLFAHQITSEVIETISKETISKKTAGSDEKVK